MYELIGIKFFYGLVVFYELAAQSLFKNNSCDYYFSALSTAGTTSFLLLQFFL